MTRKSVSMQMLKSSFLKENNISLGNEFQSKKAPWTFRKTIDFVDEIFHAETWIMSSTVPQSMFWWMNSI